MTLSPTQSGAGDYATVIPDASPATQELECRLREQTALNRELDDDVRYLSQELEVRKEFIAHLETELQSMHEFAGRQLEAVAEYSAYRSRISHRVIDRLITMIHRRPWLYRPLRQLARVAVAAARRALPPNADSTQPPDPPGGRVPTATDRGRSQ